jgi:futalosine hydrolase
MPNHPNQQSSPSPTSGHTLYVTAVEAEARAVLRGLVQAGQIPSVPTVLPSATAIQLSPTFSILIAGVGKANAAANLAIALATQATPTTAVVNAGIAGALPLPSTALLPNGSAIAATGCAFGDEGVITPTGFTGVAAMGFPIWPFHDSPAPCDPTLLNHFAPFTDAQAPIATVSTCSGTDAAASAVAARTRARAESMEGAACALVCHTLRIPFLELRTISNACGNRHENPWNIPLALARLERVVAMAGCLPAGV